jgi:putative spermidine/putrescine transport system ATP-binding protein
VPDVTAGSTGTGTTAVSTRGLTKHFGDVHAVDDLDLDIADGEFFSMLGPSGSGKTTVLRLLAGFERPTRGRILLGESDVTQLPAHRRDVNTVFQDYAIFPHMDVVSNVEYGLRVKKVDRKERRRRAEEALAAVRLEGYGARRPNQLSGGQRQRVALARALVNRPKVLLLDEPLGALDLKLRREMQLELKQIQRDVGITFVFVTHDQEEALSMSDRVAVFHEGRVEQVASPIELYERPASPFVAGFVGTSNRIHGDAARAVIGREGDFAVRPEKLRVTAPGAPLDSDEIAAPGTVREVVYLGPSTHAVVELDAGPRLTVSRPNTGQGGEPALEAGDQPVAVVFHRGALISLSD